MLRVEVVTLFPELLGPAVSLSILGRARERGLVDVRLHNVLDALGPAAVARAKGPPIAFAPVTSRPGVVVPVAGALSFDAG